MVLDDTLTPVCDVGADLVVVIQRLARRTGIKDLHVHRSVGAVDRSRFSDVAAKAFGEGRLTSELADLRHNVVA